MFRFKIRIINISPNAMSWIQINDIYNVHIERNSIKCYLDSNLVDKNRDLLNCEGDSVFFMYDKPCNTESMSNEELFSFLSNDKHYKDCMGITMEIYNEFSVDLL